MAVKTKKVVVRTYSAGVHFGTLAKRDGKEVTLKDSRRIWSWRGANTINEIATAGVGDGSRISAVSPEVVLTEAIEIHACTEAAAKNLEAAKWAP